MGKKRWMYIMAEMGALKEEERRPFLIKELAGEPSLLHKALEILEGDDEDFMTPIREIFRDWPLEIDEESVEQVGPYRIIELIGEGGMGTVYKAVQEEPVERVVALKILDVNRRGEAAIRFKAEYQALAFMEHPAIAHVYQCGITEWGRPYFTMEFCRGRQITDFCREEELDIRERVALMVRVCAGVEHAHQKGIIHRDLKPSNILVVKMDDEACPKIIDFGIAKAIGKQPLTQVPLETVEGTIIGTLSYMSPEQAETQPVDTRTDIYALGTILYELTTGSLPFGNDRFRNISPRGALSIIIEERPEPPASRARAHGRKLSRDLEAIINSCLAKRPEHRYASTSALIADLKRFLEDRPVHVRSPGFLYTMTKFIKRNKMVMVTTLLVLSALITGGVFSFLSWRQEQAIAKRFEVVNLFLLNVLKASNPDVDGRNIKVADLLNRAAERLDVDFADQPADRALLAWTLGDTYRSLGFYDKASRILEASLLKCLVEPGPTHPETLETRFVLARLHINRRHYGAAEEHYRFLLRYDHLLSRTRFLEVREGFAIARSGRGELEEAEQIFREVLQERRRDPGRYLEDTASTMVNLAINQRRGDRFDEAADLLKEALIIQEAIDANSTEILRTRSNILRLLNDRKHYEEAETEAGKLYDLRLRKLGADHPRTLGMLYEVGRALYGQKRYREARGVVDVVLQNRLRVLGRDHSETASALVMAGLIEYRLGNKGQACAVLEEALDIRIRVQGRSHLQTIDALTDLAVILSERGACARAAVLLCEGLQDPLSKKPGKVEKRAWEALENSLECLGNEREAREIRAEISTR